MTNTKLAAEGYRKASGDAWNDFKVAVIDEEGYAFFNGKRWESVDYLSFMGRMSVIADEDSLSSPDDFFRQVCEYIKARDLGQYSVIAYGGEYDHIIPIYPGQDPFKTLELYQ